VDILVLHKLVLLKILILKIFMNIYS